ncbi:hypothetical protein ACTA71_011950 [Dictyostelium dimigraforme]
MTNFRTFYIGANHKMNSNRKMLDSWCKNVNKIIPNLANFQVFLAPSIPYLDYVNNGMESENKFKICSQNCYFESKGAFDGETSATMLKDLKIPMVIVGHSERRYIFGESNSMAVLKAKNAISLGMTAIFCLSEKESNETKKVLLSQLNDFKNFTVEEWSKLIIAYEPYWATKTQVNSTPENIQLNHSLIRNWISVNVSPRVASTTSIIYGGAVNPNNCLEISNLPDVDGMLIGVYCLDPNHFSKIIQTVSNKKNL